MVSKAYLAWAQRFGAPQNTFKARRMMGRAKWRPFRKSSLLLSPQRIERSRIKRFCGLQIRQKRWKSVCCHCLPSPRRPCKKHIMPSGSSDHQRAYKFLVALEIPKIEALLMFPRARAIIDVRIRHRMRRGIRLQLMPKSMPQQGSVQKHARLFSFSQRDQNLPRLGKMGNWPYLHGRNNHGLACILNRNNTGSYAFFSRGARCWQNSSYRLYLAPERQLSHRKNRKRYIRNLP